MSVSCSLYSILKRHRWLKDEGPQLSGPNCGAKSGSAFSLWPESKF